MSSPQKVSSQAPISYYSLQEARPTAAIPGRRPSICGERSGTYSGHHPASTQSADKPQTPGIANTLTTAPADESASEKSDERSVFAMLSCLLPRPSFCRRTSSALTEGRCSVCITSPHPVYDELFSALSELGRHRAGLSAPELAAEEAGAYAVVTVYPVKKKRETAIFAVSSFPFGENCVMIPPDRCHLPVKRPVLGVRSAVFSPFSFKKMEVARPYPVFAVRIRIQDLRIYIREVFSSCQSQLYHPPAGHCRPFIYAAAVAGLLRIGLRFAYGAIQCRSF